MIELPGQAGQGAEPENRVELPGQAGQGSDLEIRVELPGQAGQGSDLEIRASDAEREQTMAFLRRHFAEGRLTLAELEERVADASEARTREQLRTLTADLPPDRRALTQPAGGTDWRILCVLLVICPPAGLAYWLLSRR